MAGSLMTAYYNEIDKPTVAWLRELIAQGHIADGIVDDRSIEDVSPDDLTGFTQCHFFAGIGGWSLALRMAGWSDDRPIWTGSCPCQDFSSAGKQLAFAGKRHLWPAFFRLIKERTPDVIVGEQVASPLALAWLDLVRDDLESADYACGAIDLAAASVGAPNIRQRLYWVADGCRDQRAPWRAGKTDGAGPEQSAGRGHDRGGLGNSSSSTGLAQRPEQPDGQEQPSIKRAGCNAGGVGDTCGSGSGRNTGAIPGAQASSSGQWIKVGNITDEPLFTGTGITTTLRLANDDDDGRQARGEGSPPVGYRHPLDADGGTFWSDVEWIYCRDDKWRPAQPSIPPLASGVPNRVALIRGAGNSINPYVAAEFLSAYMSLL